MKYGKKNLSWTFISCAIGIIFNRVMCALTDVLVPVLHSDAALA